MMILPLNPSCRSVSAHVTDAKPGPEVMLITTWIGILVRMHFGIHSIAVPVAHPGGEKILDGVGSLLFRCKYVALPLFRSLMLTPRCNTEFFR